MNNRRMYMVGLTALLVGVFITIFSSAAISGAPQSAVSVATNAQSYSGTGSLTITGSVTPAPGAGTVVILQITNPNYTIVVYNDNVTVAASGAFQYTINIVANSSGWVVSGTYALTATCLKCDLMTATSQFLYTPYAATTVTTPTVTTTVTSIQVSSLTTTKTVTSTATVTAPPSTVTNTQTTTQTATSTATMTQTASAIPDWAYGVMAVLLLAGLAIGYVVKGPSIKQS